MAIVTLGVFFYYGARTYLGAVNPDYFAGLFDDYFLLKGNSVSTFGSVTQDTHYPIDYIAGHLSASARFGAGLFGIAVKLLLHSEIRDALTVSIAFFVLTIPLTLYFFCRVVLAFQPRVAKWSSWLMGISAPTGMSYLYFYLGQNSGLPALPLAVGASYLMLARPGWRTLLFCAVVSNALFVNYFAMLPYALAPAGALGLYLLFTRRISFAKLAGMAVAFLALSVALKLGNVRDTLDAMKAWMNVIGQSLQGQFFLDFLTELYFPYFLGVINYPTNPWVALWFGQYAKIIAFGVSMLIFPMLLWGVWRWSRETAERAARVFVLSALAIYAIVWARYTFQQQYGYAVFKMSSWLQFVVVPFMAYAMAGWERRFAAKRGFFRSTPPALGYALCVFYVVLNLCMSAQYAYNGTGTNTDNGYIVNHFGVAGNDDYFELESALRPYVKPQESVGLIFTDSIRSYLTAYYTRPYRESILAHEILPGDDENLPDVETGMSTDYYGNVRESANQFFHGGASDDFYLTWGPRDINQDIVVHDYRAQPIWQDGSFQLYRASETRDLLLSGRGFYRLEYFKPLDFFFPRVIRWSAQGGEFFLIRPSHPGEPYRLKFDLLVGYEYPSDSRTLEFWLDGKKFQELRVTSTARVISAPFVFTGPVHKITVRVKERNRALPRPFALWNKDIPADYRRTNVAFANVRIIPPDAIDPTPAPVMNRTVDFLRMHPFARQFDGLQFDGWIGDDASFTLAAPEGARLLEVGGFVPGNRGFKFPFTIEATINGRPVRKTLQYPGGFALDLPIEPGERSAAVTIKAPESSVMKEEEVLRRKLISRSMKLESVTFRSEPGKR